MSRCLVEGHNSPRLEVREARRSAGMTYRELMSEIWDHVYAPIGPASVLPLTVVATGCCIVGGTYDDDEAGLNLWTADDGRR